MGAAAARRRAPTAWPSTPSAEYQGLYAQARPYIQTLRAGVGPDYPVSLASFPYVDYHPSLPYSVFLGPERRPVQRAADLLEDDRRPASDSATLHTYASTRVYGRPI